MRKCPRCGYVDPAALAADENYESSRGPRDRASYMREYRKAKKLGITVDELRKRAPVRKRRST